MHTKTLLTTTTPIAILCIVCLAAGCKDSRRHQSTDALAVPTSVPALTADAAPQEVVQRFLQTARQVQHIRESGFAEPEKQRAYDEGMAALQAITNGKQLLSNMLSSTKRAYLPAGLTEEAAVTAATESWLSVLSHYVDGIQSETLRLTAGSKPDAVLAQVLVQGENPDELAALKKLEASPEIRDAKDASGRPIVSGTPAYQKLVAERALLLDPPIAVPLRAQFVFTLARASQNDPWGVTMLRINPPARMAVAQPADDGHTRLPTP